MFRYCDVLGTNFVHFHVLVPFRILREDGQVLLLLDEHVYKKKEMFDIVDLL